MPKALKKILAIGLIAVMGGYLSACSTFFGPAETAEREAWRYGAQYVYVGLALENYVTHPQAKEYVNLIACSYDESTYAALYSAKQAAEGGGDTIVVASAALANALANLSLKVLGTGDLSALVDEASDRAVIWATVGALSASEMRIFRKNFIQPKLEYFDKAGVEPNDEDWQALMDEASRLHESIQNQCVQTLS